MARTKPEQPAGGTGDKSTTGNGFSMESFQKNEPGDGEVEPGVVWVLAFSVADRSFAVGVENTEGVVDCPRLTPLPIPPELVIGVGSVRGRITLAVDLSVESAPAVKRRLILLKGEAQLGLLADHVEGIMALRPKEVREFTETGLRRRTRSDATALKAAAKVARSYFRRDGQAVPIVDLEMVSNL